MSRGDNNKEAMEKSLKEIVDAHKKMVDDMEKQLRMSAKTADIKIDYHFRSEDNHMFSKDCEIVDIKSSFATSLLKE